MKISKSMKINAFLCWVLFIVSMIVGSHEMMAASVVCLVLLSTAIDVLEAIHRVNPK